MLTAEERITLRRNLTRYEGRVAHMYLDSHGYVTTGVGHLLPTAHDAAKLPFRAKDGRRASIDEIRLEYDRIQALPKERLHAYYRQHATLFLSDAEIDQLTNEHITTFHRELRRLYAGFDSFPPSARLALFDMIFNLGLTKLRTSWPRLNAAAANRDWLEAAQQCNRKRPVSEERNKYVRALFEQAAEVVL